MVSNVRITPHNGESTGFYISEEPYYVETMSDTNTKGNKDVMNQDAVNAALADLDDAWSINDAGHLERACSFDDFASTMQFVNRVAELAEQQDHHPKMVVEYGSVVISLHTHSADGLTRADFGLATAIDAIAQ